MEISLVLGVPILRHFTVLSADSHYYDNIFIIYYYIIFIITVCGHLKILQVLIESKADLFFTDFHHYYSIFIIYYYNMFYYYSMWSSEDSGGVNRKQGRFIFP